MCRDKKLPETNGLSPQSPPLVSRRNMSVVSIGPFSDPIGGKCNTGAIFQEVNVTNRTNILDNFIGRLNFFEI
jgi:hypothetical protein